MMSWPDDAVCGRSAALPRGVNAPPRRDGNQRVRSRGCWRVSSATMTR